MFHVRRKARKGRGTGCAVVYDVYRVDALGDIAESRARQVGLFVARHRE